MPFYVADYLADTGHLSNAEHGSYMLLIMHYWQRGSLPKDDARLASIARATLEQWSSMRDAISAFFDADWRHSRIERELVKSNAAYERRAKAGQKGGIAKSTGKQSHSNATARPEQSQPQPQKDIPPSAGAEAPLAADPDADLFRRGKQVLGKQAGGLIAKLKAHFGGEIAKARAAVEIASTKGSGAADYIGRILAPPGTGPPNGRQPTRIDTLAEIQRNSHQAMIDERAFDANPTLDLSVTADPRGR